MSGIRLCALTPCIHGISLCCCVQSVLPSVSAPLVNSQSPVHTPSLLQSLDLTPEERDSILDLTPFVSPLAYCVPEGASLSKVYSMFRHLGLRHLCVVPDELRLAGIITRRDLLAGNLRGPAAPPLSEELGEAEDVALVRSALRGGGGAAAHRRTTQQQRGSQDDGYIG